ncbi:M16 family metallopeptidase [Flavobacterium capsici]|uniref:Pitrilysin family protein n=1 Tax=Flavobacterium capsici TaxID=3075618 RepID=A0AA96EY51_9FLAO|nr:MULTISPECIES: pitrilysin family protein [unclassified Flavobacterium]WNM19403.1 pitrilysin family protein [Flavobacterium sp. PMR2A8]WNM20793.1 pitrilysin family protein [Flavobacterium sp. PMTSA4]
MKKIAIILSSLFLTITMQAQDRTQPKPGPSPKINIKKPETFSLPNGLKVLIVENHKLPRVSYSLTIDNSPYAEGNKKGVDNLTSSLLGNGSTKTPKDKFNEEIDFLGANINFFSSGASASGLSKHSKRILELMAEGALMPNFTQEEFDKEKDKLIEGLKTQEKSVSAVANRVEDVLVYGKDHPAGEYLSEETINNVSLADVKDNYRTYFVPEKAYLVIVGDVNPKEIKKQVEKLFSSWVKATAPALTYSNPKNVQYTQINFVDMPNAVQSELAIVNTVSLKVSDADYFPVIVANQIYGGDFNSYLNMNLREAHGWTYGARSSVNAEKYYDGKFVASTQVRNAVTDSAIVEALKELKRFRTEKVADDVLKNVKAGYIGRFVMQVEKPATVARYALNIQTQGLPADFYENYIKNINAVTADDVLRVAKKYMLEDNLRILVVGKATEVLPALEKLKIPIFYFDKYGNPTEKPAMKKSAPAGVTVKTVLDNYIKAIGGDKAVAAVKTLSMTGSASIPQAPAPIKMVSKKDAKGNSSMAISMDGMGELSKQVVNEKGGYSVQQGQRKEMTTEEYAEEKATAGTFDELALMKKTTLVLDGIEPYNGSDAYIVKDGNTSYYYDVKSGLKVAEAKTVERGDKKMTVTTNFGDYKDVKGVKIPYSITMNQGFELNFVLTDVKVNEGVTDEDFK